VHRANDMSIGALSGLRRQQRFGQRSGSGVGVAQHRPISSSCE